MSEITVGHTIVYPIKGFPGIPTPTKGIAVLPELGIIGDRTFGVLTNSVSTEIPHPHNSFETSSHPLVPNTGNGIYFPWTEDLLQKSDLLSDEKADQAFSHVYPNLPDSDRPRLFKRVNNIGINSRNEPYIYALNLASLRTVSDTMKRAIDPHRFRANILLEGAPPFEELSWIGKTIVIQGTAYKCKDLCLRKNISSATDTEINDGGEILQALTEKSRDHRGVNRDSLVAGILLQPQEYARIYNGNKVTVE